MDTQTIHSNKKVIFFAFGAIAVILLFLFLTFLTVNPGGTSQNSPTTIPENSTTSQQQASNNSQSLNSDNSNSYPSGTPPVLKDWTVYTNSNFSLKYPSDWLVVENNAEGTSLLLQPPIFSSGESSRAGVGINDAKRVSVASMSAGLSELGYKKETAAVAGISAQKFSRTKTMLGKTTRNSIYLFGYNEKIYHIKLSYQQEEVDKQLEQEFSQIVNNFTPR